MYKCANCGEVFDREGMVHWKESHGESLSGCPCCGVSDYYEVVKCAGCGEYFDEDALFGGYCAECLFDDLGYEEILEFLKANDYFVDFMFEKVFDMPTPNESASEKLLAELDELFHRKVAHERLMLNHSYNYKPVFFDSFVEFMREDTLCMDALGEWRTKNNK